MALIKNKKYYTDRHSELKSEYQSDEWDAVDRDKTKYLYPHGRNLDNANKNNTGGRKDTYIKDNTGFVAVRVAAAGLYAGSTNPTEKHIRLADPDKELNETARVAEFYQKCTDIILSDYANSNYYKNWELTFYDLLTYSISCSIQDEDDENIFNFVHIPNGQYYIDVDARGEVSAVYIEFCKRSRDIVEEYGEENASSLVKDDMVKGKTGGKQHNLLRVIERNMGRDIDKEDNLNMPWSAITIELGKDNTSETFLRKSGYRTKPFDVPRWSVASGNKYGHGPGDLALGDVKELQAVTTLLLQTIAKSIEPPVLAPPGTIVNSGPNEVTYLDKMGGSNRPQIEPLYLQTADVNMLVALIIDIRSRINDAFLTKLFFLISSSSHPNKTAEEIRAQKEELTRQFGSIMQVNSSSVSDRAERSFDIEYRLGRFPEIPEEIEGRPLKVEVISSLMKAQELGTIAPIENMMVTIAGMAEAWPEALDLLNPDEAIRAIEDAQGIQKGIINKDEVVKNLRAMRAQAALEEQQSIDAQQEIAGAKQLSETDMGGDNALNALIGR